MIENSPEQAGYKRMSEMGRQVSGYVRAIERATPPEPVSVDTFCASGSLYEACEVQLARADELYEMHSAIYAAADNELGQIIQLPDFEELYGLTKEALKAALADQRLHRGATLAIAIVQLAEAGSRIADSPATVETATGDDARAGLAKSLANIVTTGYDSVYSSRISGTLSLLPSARMGYPGHLTDTLYRLWADKSIKEYVEGDLYDRSQKLLPQFPAKNRLYDMHTILGRPDRSTARARFERQLERYRQGLDENRSSGFDMQANITTDIGPPILKTLDAARRKGYKLDRCLQIAVQNSVTISSTAEETGLGPVRFDGVYDIDESGMLHVLRSGTPHYCPDKFSDETIAMMTRHDASAGTCPSRHIVKLTADGETHVKLQKLSDAVIERIGTRPTFLEEVGCEVYVKPAALLANIVLLGMADSRLTQL